MTSDSRKYSGNSCWCIQILGLFWDSSNWIRAPIVLKDNKSEFYLKIRSSWYSKNSSKFGSFWRQFSIAYLFLTFKIKDSTIVHIENKVSFILILEITLLPAVICRSALNVLTPATWSLLKSSINACCKASFHVARRPSLPYLVLENNLFLATPAINEMLIDSGLFSGFSITASHFSDKSHHLLAFFNAFFCLFEF